MTETGYAGARRPATWLLAGGCLMAAAGLVLLVPAHPVEVDPALGVPLTITVIAGLFLLAEVSMFHVEVRGQALSVTISDLPLVLGLFLLPAHWLLLARLVPAVLVFVARRTAPSKAGFNLGLFTLEIAVATLLLDVFSPARALDVTTWGVTYAAVVVIDLLGAAAVVAAMRVLGAPPSRPEAVQMVVAVLISGVLSTTLALMAVVVLYTSAAGLALLAALAVVVALAHRGYYRLLRQHADLNQLFAFTQTVGAAQDSDGVVADLLVQAKELLGAETATLRLLPAGGGDAGPDDGLDPTVPVVLPRATRDPALRRWLTQEGLRDALLAPLRDGDDVVAVLRVANRRAATGTFTQDDLRLLQTLVAHAEVLWHNGRLLERLRYDARHDSLTGLGNRALFLDALEEFFSEPELVAGRREGAVLLLDLDRFKEVNDALGHPVGDRLLEQVAGRLLAHVPTGAVVSRLGGDEFAVLLRACRSPEDALATARAARAALTGPFEVGGTFLEVGASVGVAVIPSDGADGATVLRRADMAMYEAKRAATGVARYTPVQDRRSTDQLELAGELRHALQSDQVVMHFQPKASLRTGRIVGFEALARWHHPVRGLVMPDEFIPLAEQTGLMGPLTQTAIEQSLTECRGWLAGTPGVGVAVNLSPRRLLEPHMPAAVAELLERAGVPADLLTLEITESSIMGDPDAAVRALHQLRDLGVRLSVDDFGTGYSSLGYLQRLPVHEVKIDKSFIMPMASDAGAAAIVRTIVDLAHTLGLTVVAEGVEDDETRQALVDVECDVQQGYGLSRPMPAEAVGGWLLEHRRSVRPERRAGRPRAI
jgi:diguanylate cyclase (GGDEF)-like protein